MAEIKWVKITTDMFDNRKIKHIRKLPEGNNIVLIWVMLLTMAGRCNSSGMIYLTENIPYTPKMLADELGFDESVIVIALGTLERLGMICQDEGKLVIPGWEEHQNIEGMARIRQQARDRKRAERERQKNMICDSHNGQSCDSYKGQSCDSKNGQFCDSENIVTEDCHTMSRDSHAIEEDKEEDINNNIVSDDTIRRTEVQRVVDAWNQIGITPVSKMIASSTRYKMISARIREYGVDDVLKAIENIRQSEFLRGGNKRGWSPSFEWFARPNNFPKVLEGQYNDHRQNDIERSGGDDQWQ